MSFSLSIPGWEQSTLVSLAGEGALSGVNPTIIAAIDQEESSGDPGKPNSAGYGGYFGLSPTSTYPGDQVVGSGEGTNNPAEFTKEAEIAAAEFASLLNGEAHGDPVAAEFYYQNGGNAQFPGDAVASKSGGPGLISEALGGAPLQTGAQAPPSTGGTTGVASPTGQASGIDLTGIGAVLQAINGIMNPQAPSGTALTVLDILTLGASGATITTAQKIESLVVRGMFGLAFLGVGYFGLKAITSSSSGGSKSPSVIDTIESQQRIGQSQQRIDQGNTNLGISQQRASTAQHRADTQRQDAQTRASRNERISKGSKKSAKAGTTGKGIEAATADAIEAVGGAAAL